VRSDCLKALKMVQRCCLAHLFSATWPKGGPGGLKLAKKCYTHVLELDENHIERQRELRLMGTRAERRGPPMTSLQA